MDGLTRSYHLFLPPEGGVELAFEDGEGLFKVVSMGLRAAARRNVHVDETEATRGLFWH
jgi:hypothetical protein